MTINSILTNIGNTSNVGEFLKGQYFIYPSENFRGTVNLQVCCDEDEMSGGGWYFVRGGIGEITIDNARDEFPMADRLAEFDYTAKFRFILSRKTSDATTNVRVIMK